MAGEFSIAQKCVQQALGTADLSPCMNRDAMSRALLSELLSILATQHSQADLKALLDYQLDNLDEDQFVITRGC